VFLEPAEWDESKGLRPITQLDVSIEHYIGASMTDSRIAVDKSSLPCRSYFLTLSEIFSTHQLRFVGTVLWSVSKSTPNPEVVRKNFAAVRNRTNYPLFLPKGVAVRQLEKFWHELQFNPVEPVDVPFNVELFRSPPRGVKQLRLLARRGRWRLEHATRKQKGRAKVVLGIPNDARKVAPLLALAHGSGLVQTVSTSNLDARRRRKERPVRSSSMRPAGVFKDQDQTTRKDKNPQTAAPTSSHPSKTTQVHAVPKAKPIAQIYGRR
jgi:hypothetical protein